MTNIFKYICHTQVWIGSIDYSDTETKSLVHVSNILVLKTPSCLEDGKDYRKSKGFDFATFTLCGADEFSQKDHCSIITLCFLHASRSQSPGVVVWVKLFYRF